MVSLGRLLPLPTTGHDDGDEEEDNQDGADDHRDVGDRQDGRVVVGVAGAAALCIPVERAEGPRQSLKLVERAVGGAAGEGEDERLVVGLVAVEEANEVGVGLLVQLDHDGGDVGGSGDGVEEGECVQEAGDGRVWNSDEKKCDYLFRRTFVFLRATYHELSTCSFSSGRTRLSSRRPSACW